jgi:hypothetical protein
MHACIVTDYNDEEGFPHIAFALTCVCRQLYAESSPMIYSLNVFEIDCKRVVDLPSHEFLFDLIPGQREGIRVVKVTARPLLWYLYVMATTSVKDLFPGLRQVILNRKVAEDVLRFAVKAGGGSGMWENL